MAVSLSPISWRLLAVGLWGDSGCEELSEDPSDPASKAEVKKSLSYCHLHSSNKTNLQPENARWGRGLARGQCMLSAGWIQIPHPSLTQPHFFNRVLEPLYIFTSPQSYQAGGEPLLSDGG